MRGPHPDGKVSPWVPATARLSHRAPKTERVLRNAMGAHPDSPQPASHAGFVFVFVLIIFFALTIWPCCLSETHPRSVHSFKYCRWKPALEKSRKSEERSGRHPKGSPGPAQLLSLPQVSLRKARSSVVTSQALSQSPSQTAPKPRPGTGRSLFHWSMKTEIFISSWEGLIS